MRITIRHTPDCPNLEKARERVAAALREAAVEADVRVELVATLDEAERLGFTGSPTILIDGTDPFGAGGSVAFGCRFYITPDGRDTAPAVAQLRHAIGRASR